MKPKYNDLEIFFDQFWDRVEEQMGFAKYDGVFSPAIMTRILGSDSAASMSSTSLDVDFPSSSVLELVELDDEVFRKEQARISNATATSPNMRAKPPKR